MKDDVVKWELDEKVEIFLNEILESVIEPE